MRPNVDVPWSVHGQIRELVENDEYKNLSEAYEDLLRKGLE